MQLNDKVAVITGAGRGIGRAIALAFAQEGAAIVAAAQHAAEIAATARAVRELGRPALSVEVDVSQPAEVRAMVEAVMSEFGRIDILVNSAGIYGPIGPMASLDPDAWLQTIAVNLGGVFLCTHAVLPAMIAQGAGKIINLSGGGATKPRANFTAYASSKAAVVRLTETLAAEVSEHNIQVNAIAPGGVDTRLIDAVIEAGDAAGREAIEEARRLKAGGGTPIEEVTALATFLASDASAQLSGRLISALWDCWRTFPGQIDQMMSSDLYTLRRVVSEQSR